MIARLGKYRIDGILGQGAMGVVYKAFDPWIERVVALKTIRKELLDEARQEELIGRFKNEAQAAGRLNHPNIVTVYEYGEDAADDADNADGAAIAAYIAMEYVDGTPLDALLTAGRPVAPARALAWMGELLRGLDYAHARGVVHRDIKPANLLVTAAAQIKIGDFGVARIASSTLTQAGSMIGTPSYMSPEQFTGAAVDGRADIFSAAIVLYQLLTGTRPFAGVPSVVMQQILNETAPPPSLRAAALGTRFDQVLARAMAKAPAQRYGTAGDFHAALLAVAADGGGDGDDDGERTVLAGARPQALLPAADTSTGMSAWQREAFPELELLLSHQIGPMAKFLLKKSGARAYGLDQLADGLSAHIPSELGRLEFQQGVALLKKKLAASGTGTGTGTGLGEAQALSCIQASIQATATAPLPFDQAWAERAVGQLTGAIGPIARVIARRASSQTADRTAFLLLLASHIDDPAERARFLAAAGAP